MSKQRHEVAQIELRYVRDTARRRYDLGSGYSTWCRGKKHEGIGWPWWNIRFSYKTHSVRGGGMGMYWCDVCLPARYRTVADSMLRGGEQHRVLRGKALERVTPRPRRKEPVGIDRIPWRQLL
jgi:hypothetical protein